MRGKIIGLILGVLLFSGGLVQAVPITIQISGEVTSLGGYTEAIPDTIYAGVSFAGSYTYDSSTPDSEPAIDRGVYLHDSPYGITISLGGYEFKTTPSHTGQFEIRIGNDMPGDGVNDYYIVFSDDNITIPYPGFTINSIRWDLGDSTHTALTSDNLPITAPVLTDWEGNELTISGSGVHGLLITGTVTQATPEPLTGVFLAVGALLLRRRL